MLKDMFCCDDGQPTPAWYRTSHTHEVGDGTYQFFKQENACYDAPTIQMENKEIQIEYKNTPKQKVSRKNKGANE